MSFQASRWNGISQGAKIEIYNEIDSHFENVSQIEHFKHFRFKTKAIWTIGRKVMLGDAMKIKPIFVFTITATLVGLIGVFTNMVPMDSGVPVLLQQPLSQGVEPGASATFTVQATGANPMHYFWQFNGKPISGANASSLTIPQALVSSMGQYSVVVENALGKVSSQVVSLRLKGAEFPINSRRTALFYPNGLGVDASGVVFASDMMNKRVVAISPANRLIRQVSVSTNPTGLVLSNGFVYVNLTNNGQVSFNGPINKYDLNFNLISSHPAPFVVRSFVVVDSVIYGAVLGSDSQTTIYSFDTKIPKPVWVRMFTVNASSPKALAMNSKGHFYIADAAPGGKPSDSWVKEFDKAGNLLKQLKIPSAVTGMVPGGIDINYFSAISALVIDSSDRVLVADSFGRVLTFNNLGNYVGQLYPHLPLHTQLQGAYAIAIDAQGNRYVADSTSIKEFSESGMFIKQFGAAGVGVTRLSGPSALTLGRPNSSVQDNLYVVDQLNGSVKVFSPQGLPLFQIDNNLVFANGATTALLSLLRPQKVSVGVDGSIYVHWSGNYKTMNGGKAGVAFSGVLLKYDASGRPANEIFGFTTRDGSYTVGSEGTVYMLNSAESRIDVFPMSAFSSQGVTPFPSIVLKNNSGKITFPASAFAGNIDPIRKDLFRDSKGQFYLHFYDSSVSPAVTRILKFGPKGMQLASMTVEGSVGDLAVDSAGMIYATCGNSLEKICAFNSDGSARSTFGSQGIGVGQFWFASGIAVDSMDHILVTDSINSRVTKFGPDGEPLIH